MSLTNYSNFQQLTTAVSRLHFLLAPCNTPIKYVEAKVVPFSLFQSRLINQSSSPIMPPKGDFSIETETEEEQTTKGHAKRHTNIICPAANLMTHLITYVAHAAIAPFSWFAQRSQSTDYAGCLPHYLQMLAPSIQHKEPLGFLERFNTALPTLHEYLEPFLCTEPFPNWIWEEDPRISSFPLTARENEQFMHAAIDARGEEVLISVGLNYQGNIADLVKYATEKSKEKPNPPYRLIWVLPMQFQRNKKYMEQIIDEFGALAFSYAHNDLKKDPDFFQYVRNKALKEIESSEYFSIGEYSSELKADKEIMMRAVDKFERFGFERADPQLQKDPEFYDYARKKMIEEIRKGFTFIFYLPAPFKEDEVVIQDAVDHFGWNSVKNYLSPQEQEAIRKKLPSIS